jgi:N-acyl-D-aspartate/D-glutamate deacylase
VRDKRLMPFEEAVRQLTSYPAQVFGITDRGRLRPGACADLLLIDPASVGRGPARRVRDLPAGASRLNTPAVGVHGVWVNGEKIADGNGVLPQARRRGLSCASSPPDALAASWALGRRVGAERRVG